MRHTSGSLIDGKSNPRTTNPECKKCNGLGTIYGDPAREQDPDRSHHETLPELPAGGRAMTNEELIARNEAYARYQNDLDIVWIGALSISCVFAVVGSLLWKPLLWIGAGIFISFVALWVVTVLCVGLWVWIEAIRGCIKYKKENPKT